MKPEDFAELRRLAQWDERRRESEKVRRLAMCAGKERFDSLTLAQQVAKRRSERGRPCHAYACQHCHTYHVGWRPPLQSTRIYKRRKEALA